MTTPNRVLRATTVTDPLTLELCRTITLQRHLIRALLWLLMFRSQWEAEPDTWADAIRFRRGKDDYWNSR